VQIGQVNGLLADAGEFRLILPTCFSVLMLGALGRLRRPMVEK
jgi:hypothetical protein